MSRAIAFFDFDGTITNSDSLAAFIRYKQGDLGFITGIIPVIPSIVAFKAGLIDRQDAKEKLMSRFFAGISDEQFRLLAADFVRERLPRFIRPKARERLAWHQREGHEIVIVSASPSHWVEPWCTTQAYSCIATELEIVEGKITGKIVGRNCHGTEKVRRIKERFNLADFNDIYAYGDTSGDKPMLELASFSFYKPFL